MPKQGLACEWPVSRAGEGPRHLVGDLTECRHLKKSIAIYLNSSLRSMRNSASILFPISRNNFKLFQLVKVQIKTQLLCSPAYRNVWSYGYEKHKKVSVWRRELRCPVKNILNFSPMLKYSDVGITFESVYSQSWICYFNRYDSRCSPCWFTLSWSVRCFHVCARVCASMCKCLSVCTYMSSFMY